MVGCFTCCHRRSRSENDTKLPKKKEEPQEGETLPAAPETTPAPESEPQPQEVELPPSSPPTETLLDPTRGSLLLLQKRLQVLKEMQGQYLQAELKIRSTCHQFPRSLRTASLQICRTRRRLIRTEVRLQRQEREGGGQAAHPGVSHSFPGTSSSPSKPTLVSTSASASGEVVSLTPTTSSFSLPLHPLSPPPPAPPLLQPDIRVLQEVLETLLEMEAHQLQERRRDLRTCQECLRSLRELRAQLQKVRSRLWRVEATLGIQVPPRELDMGEQEEEEE